MDSEQKQFLSLPDLPARLTQEQTAWALGFTVHDVPVLVATGLLKPLGRPPPNGQKFFAAAELRELKTDRKWLARATDAVHEHWRHKNQRPPLRPTQTNARSRAKPPAMERTA
jgi:hypothetical protein